MHKVLRIIKFALQGFFQNVAMLIAVGSYTYAASQEVDPVTALLALGGLVFIATFLVSLRLPEAPGKH